MFVLGHFLLFIKSGTPTQRLAPPTYKVALPTSLIPALVDPSDILWTFASVVILGSLTEVIPVAVIGI